MNKVKVTLYLSESTARELRVKAAEIGGQGAQSKIAEQILSAGLRNNLQCPGSWVLDQSEIGGYTNLQELTGRESGIVVYGDKGLLCNWASFEGLPRPFATGLIGMGEKIPEAAGERIEDLNVLLDGVDVESAYEIVAEDHVLAAGVVYRISDEVMVVVPDGWA